MATKKQTAQLESRLNNWKFETATKYLVGQSQDVKDVVRSLARTFGNCGWFEGDMATIIAAAVQSLKVGPTPRE